MTDNGTLRDHLADVINERNELLRKIESLEAFLYKQGILLGFMERRLEELTQQQSALWKVESD